VRDQRPFNTLLLTTAIGLLPLPLFAAEPPEAAPQPSAVLNRLMELNPHLAADDPRELPMKLRSLLQDEYGFFCGAADLFYVWCGEHCRDWLEQADGIVQLHGDFHIGNIGTYQAAGIPGRDVYFGVRDLDETVRGPVQLDLLRAMTGLRFVAAGNGLPDYDSITRPAARKLIATYVSTLQGQASLASVVGQSRRATALLAEARQGKMGRYLRAYYDQSQRTGFVPVRVKKKSGEVADFMEPVDDAKRKQIVNGLWSYFQSETASGASKRFRPADGGQFEAGVLALARWTRLDSGAGQGLTEYLVLLDRTLIHGDIHVILQLTDAPAPAAARAGVLPSSSGPARARGITTAYRQFQLPTMWFVGAVEIEGQGFLLKSKDPWRKEPSPRDFSTSDSLVEAAELLGAVLGSAHRRGLADPAGEARTIGGLLADLETTLLLRSAEAEAYLREQFRLLRADPVAQGYLELADGFIEQRAEGHAPKPRRRARK